VNIEYYLQAADEPNMIAQVIDAPVVPRKGELVSLPGRRSGAPVTLYRVTEVAWLQQRDQAAVPEGLEVNLTSAAVILVPARQAT
jgi:hypothetical protein